MAVCKRLLGLALSLCVLAAAAFAASASAGRPLSTGFEIHRTHPEGTPDHLSWQYQKAHAAGAQFVRLVAYWDSLEPSEGSYEWATLDDLVNRARAARLQPLVTIVKAPSWAERSDCGTTPSPTSSCNPDPIKFGEFARALANHYRGRVRHWEVWNEPNLSWFLRPQQKDGKWYSPILYRQLLNRFASAVHAVDASATVVAGATAPFRHGTQPGPLPFMRGVLCLTGKNKPACRAKSQMDAWSTHPYTSGGPTHKAANVGDVSLGDLPAMHRVLRAAIAAHHIVDRRWRPHSARFWVTEFGWDSKGPDPVAVPMRLHARWTSEALYRSWRAGVSVFIWHQMRDRPFPSNPYQAGLFFCGRAGLSDEDQCGTSGFNYSSSVRKLSWQAFHFPFVAYAGNGRLRLWGRAPGAAPGRRIVIERKTSGGWRRVTTTTSNRVGIFAKTIRYSRTRGFVRARIGTATRSLRFSLVRPPDRSVSPFGCGGRVPCP